MSYKSTVSKEWRGREVKIQGRKAIRRSGFEIGLIVEGQAKLLSAVDTGRLAASITVQATDQGTMPKGRGADLADVIAKPTDLMMVHVGTPVEYGPYQEFGTVRSEAQPFLRPALDLAKGKTLTILESNGRLQFKEYLRVA